MSVLDPTSYICRRCKQPIAADVVTAHFDFGSPVDVCDECLEQDE